jgi:hypothetical protein
MTLDWRSVERFAAVHLGIIHLGLGLTILAGGIARFPAPTYTPLLIIDGGRVWPYGLMFMVSATLLILPGTRINFWGHWLGLVFMDAFAAIFLAAVIQDRHAGATAWWAYFSFGTIHGFNIALMLVRRNRNLYRDLPPIDLHFRHPDHTDQD